MIISFSIFIFKNIKLSDVDQSQLVLIQNENKNSKIVSKEDKYVDERTFINQKMSEEFQQPLNDYFFKIKECIRGIKILASDYQNATLRKHEVTISQNMDQTIQNLIQIQTQVKTTFDNFEKVIEEAKEKDKDEPETRMMQIQYALYWEEFSELIKKVNEAKSYYQDMIRQRTFRQTQLINDKITEEEFDKIMKNPLQNTELQICEQILKMPSLQLKTYVSDIQEKYSHILQLQKSLIKMHQLVNQVSLLVFKQGKLTNTIVECIQDAKDYNEKAIVVLEKEKERHIASRKKQYLIMSIGLLIIIIIVLSSVLGTR